MAKVKRWVCDACGALWYAAPNNRCPSCGGPGSEKDVTIELVQGQPPKDEK